MKEKIAIVGIGCVFPDAMDFTEYWRNIVEGKDSVRDISGEFWEASDFYDADIPNLFLCEESILHDHFFLYRFICTVSHPSIVIHLQFHGISGSISDFHPSKHTYVGYTWKGKFPYSLPFPLDF